MHELVRHAAVLAWILAASVVAAQPDQPDTGKLAEMAQPAKGFVSSKNAHASGLNKENVPPSVVDSTSLLHLRHSVIMHGRWHGLYLGHFAQAARLHCMQCRSNSGMGSLAAFFQLVPPQYVKY